MFFRAGYCICTGELHLEIIVDRLRREFKVECEVGAPQVNYREGISRQAEVKRRDTRITKGMYILMYILISSQSHVMPYFRFGVAWKVSLISYKSFGLNYT